MMEVIRLTKPLSFETPLHLLAWLEETFPNGAWLSRPRDRDWGYFLCQPMVTGWYTGKSFRLQADCIGVEKGFAFPVATMTETTPAPTLFTEAQGRTFRLDCLGGEAYLLDTEVPPEIVHLAHQAKIESRFFYTLDPSLIEAGR